MTLRQKLSPHKKILTKCTKYFNWANFATAVSTVGLSVLGIFTADLTLPTLVICASLLGLLGVVGRYINSLEDDCES